MTFFDLAPPLGRGSPKGGEGARKPPLRLVEVQVSRRQPAPPVAPVHDNHPMMGRFGQMGKASFATPSHGQGRRTLDAHRSALDHVKEENSMTRHISAVLAMAAFVSTAAGCTEASETFSCTEGVLEGDAMIGHDRGSFEDFRGYTTITGNVGADHGSRVRDLSDLRCLERRPV